MPGYERRRKIMAINYNALPSEKPATNGTIIPKGQYVATIEKAEMKQGKDDTKPPYLNIQMDIVDEASGQNMGKLFHILTESNHPIPMYQLKRLIESLNLPITGEFELKDLVKMIQGKKLLVDIEPEKAEEGKPAARSVVDVFSGQIFYPYVATANPLEDDTFVSGGDDVAPAPTVPTEY